MSDNAVLYVEDDETDVFLMGRAWERAGLSYALHVVRDGRGPWTISRATGSLPTGTSIRCPASCSWIWSCRGFMGSKFCSGFEGAAFDRWFARHHSLVVHQERDLSAAEALGITDYWLKSA